jgi:hypothetical protein
MVLGSETLKEDYLPLFVSSLAKDVVVAYTGSWNEGGWVWNLIWDGEVPPNVGTKAEEPGELPRVDMEDRRRWIYTGSNMYFFRLIQLMYSMRLF